MSFDDYPENKGFVYAAAFFYSLVVAVLWLPAFILRRIARFLTEAGTDSWPRANGSITAFNVKVIHGWVVDYALGRLDYSYRVAGEYYAGSVTRQYPDEQAGWDFVDAHRNEPVIVRYRDDKSQISVLRAADQGPSWNSQPQAGLLEMVWRHLGDEVRGDPPSPDEDPGLVEGSQEEDDSEDPVHH